MPLARELPLLPGAEITGPEVAAAGPSAILRAERTVLRVVLHRDGVAPAYWAKAQRRAKAAPLGHLPHAGSMELPRVWRTVLNGEKEPIAIEGHVAIA
eukprot:5721313-Alexandrium_andersonii.AAC.1